MFKSSFYLFLWLFFLTVKSLAQDSSAYELQRAKINALLAERSAKFGKYDESLTARTGIFGLQTKRDIRNSNEILRQIVLDDNAVFTELKVLMDYKDLQMQAAKLASSSSNERIANYRKTIKDLQENQEKLNLELRKAETGKDFMVAMVILFALAASFLSFLLIKIRQRNQLKSTPVAKL